MAGIYLHIPFCSTKCGYCDFYSIVDQSRKKEFVNTLIKEIYLRKSELVNNDITTIYFGGGTPSLLEVEDFKKIFSTFSSIFSLASVKEITIEVNPDDLSVAYLTELRNIGFNRLSIGIQSFKQKLLHLMNRRHDVIQAKQAVYFGREAGFQNISIDLIYGLPSMEFSEWQETLTEAVNLNVEHISSYHLTFEKGTPFYYKLKKGDLNEISDEASIMQFNELRKVLKANGYIDYEISNFAKAGKESMHNSSYWKGVSYFGFGPSAHSFSDNRRRWNISNLKMYLSLISEGKEFFEYETLTNTDMYNELMMLGLRLRKGLDFNLIKDKFTPDIVNHFKTELQIQVDVKNVCIENERLFIPDDKRFITDKIISDFFLV